MKRLILVLSIFVAICFSQQAILDNFTAGLKLNYQGGNFWSIGWGTSIAVTSNTLVFGGATTDRTIYTVSSFVPGTAPGPYASACSSSQPCVLVTMATPTTWTPAFNNTADVIYFVFHNLTTPTGGSCTGASLATWTQYVDVENYNPVFDLIVKVDATHFWFWFEQGLDVTNCTFAGTQIFNNCAKCGGNMLVNPGQYIFPGGFFAQNTLPGQTFQPTMNQLHWIFTVDKTVAAGINDSQIGMYAKTTVDPDVNNQGDHPYHSSIIDMYANVPVYIVQTRALPHTSTGFNGYPDDYTLYNGSAQHFWLDYTHFYMALGLAGGIPNSDLDLWAGATWKFNDFIFDTVPNQPDEYFGSVWYDYTGVQSGTTGRYDFAWQTPLNTCATYDFYYSGSDMKVAGLTSGTFWGSESLNCIGPQSEYVFNSPDTPLINPAYIAGRPHMEVGNVSTDTNGHMMVTTGDVVNFGNGTDPEMATGDHITISNVAGCTAANGSWTVTDMPPVSFPSWNFTSYPYTNGTNGGVVVAGWSFAASTLTNVVITSGSNNVTVNTIGGPTPTIGEQITIVNSGVSGLDGITTPVVSTGTNSFVLSIPGATPGTYTTSSINVTTGIATATTTVAHGLQPGRVVNWIGQDTPAAVILSTPSSTTFTFYWIGFNTNYAHPAGTFPGGLSDQAGAFLYIYEALELQGSGACNSPFTAPTTGLPSSLGYLVSTENNKNFFQVRMPFTSGGVSVNTTVMTGKVKAAGKVVIKPQ